MFSPTSVPAHHHCRCRCLRLLSSARAPLIPEVPVSECPRTPASPASASQHRSESNRPASAQVIRPLACASAASLHLHGPFRVACGRVLWPWRPRGRGQPSKLGRPVVRRPLVHPEVCGSPEGRTVANGSLYPHFLSFLVARRIVRMP